MKELKQKNKTPPGGWRYTDPDTGFNFRKYRTIEELVDRVTTYRLHNNLPPIPSLRLIIEHWLCCQPNMEQHCKPTTVVSRSLRQYLQGAKAAVKIAASGDSAYTTQQEAEARAVICVDCFQNVENKKHSRLGRYTDKYLRSMVGSRRTSLDEQLFSCNLCTCPLRPKVHVTQSIIEEALTRKERGVLKIPMTSKSGKKFYCWQFKPVTEPQNAEEE